MFSILSEPNQTKAVIVSGALKELVDSWHEYTPILNKSSNKLISASKSYLESKPSEKTEFYDNNFKGALHKLQNDLEKSVKRSNEAIFNVEFIKDIDPDIFLPIRADLYLGTKTVHKLYHLNQAMQKDAHENMNEAPSLDDIGIMEDRSKVIEMSVYGDKRMLRLGNKLIKLLC